MKMKKMLFVAPLVLGMLSRSVSAHCPLCTISAAAVAGGATWLGVNQIVVGLFMGAFAASMGWWFSGLVKKRFFPMQKPLIILLIFITTILPVLPLIGTGIFPLHISVAGDYGSLLNRTYVINSFLAGSIAGGLLVSLTPWLSSRITLLRNRKTFPFQGTVLTISLLLIFGAIIQVAAG